MPKVDEINLKTLPEVFDNCRLQGAAVLTGRVLAHVAQRSSGSEISILAIGIPCIELDWVGICRLAQP